MTKNFSTDPAKIYQFPIKNMSEPSSRGARTDAGENLHSNLAVVCVPKVTFGNAWYHEEAVQEAKAVSKT